MGTGVVLEWLHLVKVLTGLFLESVLAVEDQLERVQVTDGLFSEHLSGSRLDIHKLGQPELVTQRCTCSTARSGTVRNQHRVCRIGQSSTTGHHRTPSVNTPDQFLDWVVVGQSDLLGRSLRDRIGTSVLHLLDQVFVTLLRESSTLFSVEVDVVTPHLESGSVQVRVKVGRQVKVNSDFVVLQGNQWQGQSWVTVEEEDEWQVNGPAGVTDAEVILPQLALSARPSTTRSTISTIFGSVCRFFDHRWTIQRT